MPHTRPKASDMATEGKRLYMPWIEKNMPQCPVRSYLHHDSAAFPVTHDANTMRQRLRVAVVDGDPVDVALDWYQADLKDPRKGKNAQQIPVVNMANEKRAGGDWESGLMAPEECFARRSNLVHTLVAPWGAYEDGQKHYPIPQRGGIYSPYVVVFRDGPEQYQVWGNFPSLPVISVAPVRRPKLDETGQSYSFDAERELMLEKMRTVLRIAAVWKHRDICLGAFGVGPAFRNPVGEVARMWRDLLFKDDEFAGAFDNVVFAIDSNQPGNSKGAKEELEVFKSVLDANTIYYTTYR